MLLGEPPTTQADIHFRLFGFPVRIHPFFWVISLILGMGGLGRGEADPVATLIWVVAVFVSILLHELGHAVMQRRYGGHPWITLYAMGGLASCDDCDRSPPSQIIIALAGPVAGFCLAVAVMLTASLAGHYVGFVGVADARPLPLGPFTIYFKLFESPQLNMLIYDLLWINVMWGLLNLLPIYPLDGGRISRELFTLRGSVRQGIVLSLWLSVFTAGGVALYGLTQNRIFLLLMFGYLAYLNYQAIQQYNSYGTGH